MENVTAELHNYTYDEARNVYYGEIHNDTRKRWPEGRVVRTSSVVSVKGDLVYTLNSIYRLVK